MRRLFTLAVGIGIGGAVAILLTRALKRARKSLPAAIAEQGRAKVSVWQELLRQAVEEGRTAMRRRAAELLDGSAN